MPANFTAVSFTASGVLFTVELLISEFHSILLKGKGLELCTLNTELYEYHQTFISQ